MGRSIAAVIAGAVVWSVLYQSTFPIFAAVAPDVWKEVDTVDHAGWLAGLVALTLAYSILAGYVTGVVARTQEIKHAMYLGILQLSLGLVFEIMFWSFTPAWYHITFLALLVPGNLYGGRLRAGRTRDAG